MFRSPPHDTQTSTRTNNLNDSLIDLQNNSFQEELANPYASQNNNEVYATSVKLPQFWTSCPEAWFVHTEMQFNMKNITQDTTKYEHTITALPQEVIVTILDFIQNPPHNNKFSELKKILIEKHSLSENRKLDKILPDSEMGDRKPSELYRSLMLLAGSNFSQDILKRLWLRKLPKNLSTILASSSTNDINELVKLADNIWEAINKTEISAMNT
ncbi:PREDICTED: uncharacterized protein LOC108375436 [Rhagoletis zephyria]|uniref:uncharacterized protein LOC108375436 n=1 Tax=Rhagoletis zephyria TaxID=28612 RepID=UPI000811590A|nr:PREDICTED: uncharacterized protein LOC108375436 [Rhagoletis zephyria]